MPPNHNLLYQDVLLVECLEAIRTLPAHLYTQQISQVIAKIEDHLSLAIPVTTFNRFAKKYYSPFNRKKFNKISRVVNVSTQEYPKSRFKVHRPCRPQDIQPDVLKYICKIIHGKNRNNNKDLINFGLTCKNWCKAALKQLYYSPNFDSVEKLSNLSVSISYIDVKPRYVNYIQELHLPRVPDSKNTILYRKHVESIAAGGNIVCLTAPSIKIDFLNRILFYCPNIERLSVDSVVLLEEESDNAVEIQMLAQQCECLMDVRFEFVETPKFSYEDSIDGTTDNSQTQNEEYSVLNASSIPIPVGNSSFLSTSPPSKGFGGSNRFSAANNRKSFEGSNVFMDRPASALSISNRPNANLLSGSIEFPSGGVSGIASFFERPSSALSNASNTTNNSISDLKRIVQMEDVVLNGLGRKLELLTKRHLSLSAINGIIKHCPQLKRVRLIDPMDCLSALPKFENLISIDITTSRKSHIKQFSHIFNSRTFTRLEHIKLEYEPPVNRPIQRLDQLLFHFSMSAILSHCPRLKSLIHPIYPSTQDEFLNLLKTMRSLPDLRALSLRNYVNDRLLTTVSQKFPSLEALDISNTCYVSGYGIVDVVVNCVNLKYFGIYGIPICDDDIHEIQRRLPKCHIFSQFDPKWIWGENKYYLWDTVIYKDDEWKKNDHYEEELLEEEEVKEEEEEQEKEEEIVGAPSEVSSSCQISEVSESVHEPDVSIPENEVEADATPTTPTIVVTEEMEHQGININDDVDEEPEIVTDDEEGKANEIIKEELEVEEQKEEVVVEEEEEVATKEKPEIQESLAEDNDETIKGSTLYNKNDISEEQVFEPEGDNNSLDEDYINEEYSQNQTIYDHQEETVHDSTVDVINIDDDNEQVSSPQDEDLQIRKDINDLLENTIFMEDEKPLDIKDSKNNSTSNDNLYSVEE